MDNLRCPTIALESVFHDRCTLDTTHHLTHPTLFAESTLLDMEFLRKVFNACTEMVVIADRRTNHVDYVNNAIYSNLGYDNCCLDGVPVTKILAVNGKAVQSETPQELAGAWIRRDASRIYANIFRFIHSPYIIYVSTIEGGARDRHVDPLTGLGDRRMCGQALAAAIESANTKRHAGGDYAVLFVDLDDFKPVNDRLGHWVGDCALRIVGDRMLHCVRTDDVVTRYGGDEFVIVIHNVASPGEVAGIVGRIEDALSQPFDINGHRLHIGASVGCVLGSDFPPGEPPTVEDLLTAADRAMYAVKETRRQIRRQSPSLREGRTQ